MTACLERENNNVTGVTLDTDMAAPHVAVMDTADMVMAAAEYSL